MRRVIALVAVLGILLSVNVAWGQSLPAAKPEQVGLSSQRLEAIGQRDPASGAPMTKDAIFRLYSMTKPFTSVAAMILAEEGKLTLADPVSKYLPPLATLQVAVPKQEPDGKTTHTLVPAERPMTVQDLLRHTSGIVYGNNTPNQHVKEAYLANGVDWKGVTPDEQIARLAKAPLAHHPGTVWEYSLSTDVLGRVVEAASGMPLGAFLGERLFGPLRIKDTAFVVPKEKLSRLAQPFAKDKETGKPIELHDVTVAPKNDAGGAGTAGTAMDYARFLQMLANGGQLDGVRVLSRATVAYMTADHLDTIKPAIPTLQPGYGFGLGFAVRKGNGVNNAIGSADEFNWGGAGGTGFWVDPKEKLVAIVMAQTMPGPAQRIDRALFRHAVYQAIVD
jgi:CubicO group peptidase (beta-lactamase class C family)